MDKDQAKFLLSSFRPDGQDANDEQLREALEFTMQERELSEWLVEERAFDAQFSSFLNQMPVPAQLKEELCDLLNHLDEYPIAENIETEDNLAGSLSKIQPTKELRGNILAAMYAQEEVKTDKIVSFSSLLRKYAPLSIAALLLFAVGLGLTVKPQLEAEQTVSRMQDKAGLILTSHFSLDHVNHSQAELFDWLSTMNLPNPQDLPQVLIDQNCIGCKALNIEGQVASLICFNTDELGKMHLVVFDLDESSKALSDISNAHKKCRECENTGLSMTHWKSEEQGFMLFSTVSADQLSEVF